MNEQRVIDLEVKMSYQEIHMDELQKVVDEQYHKIEKLEKALQQIIKRLKSDENSIRSNHEKPPHY